MKKLILSLALMFSVFAAHAAGSVTGVIVGFFAAQSSIMLVYPSATLTTPACAQTGRFAIDTSTNNGQQQATAIRIALALGKTVQIYGTGTCNAVFTDTENVVSLYVSN